MNTCSTCSKPLPTSLDEYGPDLLRPVCRDCWFDSPALIERLQDELEAAKAYLDETDSDWYLTDTQIEILDEMIRKKTSLTEAQRKIKNLNRRIKDLERSTESRRTLWGQVVPTIYPIINNQYSFLEDKHEHLYFAAIPA